METDGISQAYIKQLSHTWNALTEYLSDENSCFTREIGILFLKEKYSISDDITFSHLRPIDKRRKRAVLILVYCTEGKSFYRKKDYWPCDFHDPFEPVFSSFLSERKSHDYALSTINRDIYTLNHFSKFLDISETNGFADITARTFQDFMKWMSASKNLPTLKNATATLRQLAKYLFREGILEADYSSAILQVRCRKTIPSVYDQSEIKTMLDSLNKASAVGIRNHAMVLMAAQLGMRASDICGLEFENLHWEKSTVEFVTQKTGKATVLPLTADVGNAIIKYLKEVRPASSDSHVFLRMQAPYTKLNPAALHSIVTKAFRDADIIVNPGRRHGPHSLRHSLAYNMLGNGSTLGTISNALGHTSVESTMYYLGVDIGRLMECSLAVPPVNVEFYNQRGGLLYD